jgi:hypothetical protein
MTDYAAAENFILKRLESELPKDLSYHGMHHMLDVLNAALEIAAAEGITNEEELKILRIGALLHDVGFIYKYQGHEEKGCELASKLLPQFGFDGEQIKKICGMISATKLPQEPHTELERIIADADLDYLGREDFYPIAKTLFDEWKVYLNITDENEWNRIQADFLSHHHYHTAHCVKWREPEKQKRLREIKSLVKSQ